MSPLAYVTLVSVSFLGGFLVVTLIIWAIARRWGR